MNRLMGFLGGMVEAEARGNQRERLMELCNREGICIYRPQCTEEGTLRFQVRRRDFKRLRKPAFKSASRIKIIKKRGLYLLVRPYRHRWGLAIGLLLFMGLIFYSSAFIWEIEVRGCEKSSAQQIESELQAMGLMLGCRRNIDVNSIENRYLKGNLRLSWMSINIRGTTAYVDVKEKDLTPEIVDLAQPTNIYAARSGVISSIMDYNGERMVEEGEAVTEGQLLVSGDRTDQYGVRRLCHCIATIMANTERKAEIRIPLSGVRAVKTGKKQHFLKVSCGKLKFPLYFKRKIHYNKYNTHTEEYPLRLGSFVFPLRLRIETAEELKEEPYRRSAAEGRRLAQEQLFFHREDRLAGIRILRCETQEKIKADELILSAVFYCEEEIGMSMPIRE